MPSPSAIRCARSLARALVLLVLLAAHGATADGARVMKLHEGDLNPWDRGWDYWPPALVQFRGIADDQGLAAWEIDDPAPGEAFYYTMLLQPWIEKDAREAGFTMRIRLRLPPLPDAVHPSDGMAGFGLRNGPQLLFGTGAAPPAGDGSLRVLAVGGPPEVVIPGGSV